MQNDYTDHSSFGYSIICCLTVHHKAAVCCFLFISKVPHLGSGSDVSLLGPNNNNCVYCVFHMGWHSLTPTPTTCPELLRIRLVRTPLNTTTYHTIVGVNWCRGGGQSVNDLAGGGWSDGLVQGHVVCLNCCLGCLCQSWHGGRTTGMNDGRERDCVCVGGGMPLIHINMYWNKQAKKPCVKAN